MFAAMRILVAWFGAGFGLGALCLACCWMDGTSVLLVRLRCVWLWCLAIAVVPG